MFVRDARRFFLRRRVDQRHARWLGGARRPQLGPRPRRHRRRPRLRRGRTRTRSTPSRTATSRSTTSTRPRSARCTSRAWASEIVLWSSQEFGFCEPPDSFASGSSIMPQKKNPDAAELLRGKAPRVAASWRACWARCTRCPLAYSKDMQEDKEPLFDAIDNLELCLEAATGCSAGSSFNRERLAAAAARRDARRDRPGGRAGRRGDAVPRGPRRRRRPGADGGRVAASALSELGDAELDGVPDGAREALREALARRARSSRRSLPAAPRRPGSPSSSTTPAQPGRAQPGACRGRWAELDRRFFERSVHEVARDLIGCTLAVGPTAGVIVETEAYDASDPACHAYSGRTARNEVLFGPPGRAYVYLSYGDPQPAERGGGARGQRGRGSDPRAGADRRGRADARAPRPRRDGELCSGPGKLTEALGVGLDLNGADARRRRSRSPSPERAGRDGSSAGPRIGITRRVELPWRYCAAGSRFAVAAVAALTGPRS